jgi:glycosyltransferase involved in cell wall biosynthesis
MLLMAPMELALLPVLAVASAVARLWPKRVDVGLGPEPLVNNVYHKRALERHGYTAETFVHTVYFTTDAFDVRADLLFRSALLQPVRWFYLFLRAVFRYRALYIYFSGGPLFPTAWVWRLEPHLLHLAGVKVLVLPYGADVQDLSRCPNPHFKHAMSRDYPGHRHQGRKIARRIDLWTRHADHVIGGCDWVDYLYYWDTLMLAHFSIDVEEWTPADPRPTVPDAPLRILHAPNHRHIKGTQHLVEAVEALNQDGVAVDLEILEGVPNAEVHRAIARADIVVDQLIIGWYAMFAIEAMAMGKPLLCYLRPDLKQFYETAGLVRPGEIPIVECSTVTVRETVRHLALSRETLADIGRRSREYVLAHHSLAHVGRVFAEANRAMGLAGAARPDANA